MKIRQFLLFTLVAGFFSTINAAEFDAKIGWADVREIGVPISGQISKVLKAGSYVKSGDTMLSISCGLYKAQLAEHKAMAEGVMPAVETALKEKELADELFERTVLSVVEHRNAELIYIKTKAKYEAAQARAEQAKIRVSFCDIKASNPSIVLKNHVTSGEYYSLESKKPVLLTVASRSSMLATARLTQPVKRNYSVGLSAKVSLAGKTYKGRVYAVDYPAQGGVLVSVIFNAFDPRLIDNKTAKIIIQ